MIFEIFNTASRCRRLEKEFYKKITQFIYNVQLDEKNYKAQVKIDSIEQLMQLQKIIDYEIIISYKDGENCIEIYDDWRE